MLMHGGIMFCRVSFFYFLTQSSQVTERNVTKRSEHVHNMFRREPDLKMQSKIWGPSLKRKGQKLPIFE